MDGKSRNSHLNIIRNVIQLLDGVFLFEATLTLLLQHLFINKVLKGWPFTSQMNYYRVLLLFG